MVRTVMVRHFNPSIRFIQATLEHNGTKLDKETVRKHCNAIYEERTWRHKTEEVGKALAEFEDLTRNLEREFWMLILDKDKVEEVTENGVKSMVFKAGVPVAVRARAIEALAMMRSKLLDKKFDAGLFDRKIGTIKGVSALTPENQKLLDTALSYVLKGENKSHTPFRQGLQGGTRE
ncbi:MAG TPA: hypothetical protein VJ044_19615 [Candidatus Hodarchaeales archaeon]|nr:hypothetical protein [Candidatus Hodarchaeales archaeon]